VSEKRARPSRAQFIAVIVVTIALSVVVDFGRRMTATHRLQEVVKDMEREVATLEAEREILLTRRAYAGSDAAVEEWARKERIMVKEGETAVIPLLQGTPPPPTPVLLGPR